MANGIALERAVANIELTLSEGAVIPVLGTVAGIGKVLFGIIQTVGALLVMVFSSPFVWSGDGRKVFCRAGTHFVNGIANIVAGALEAIPLVGSAFAGFRIWRTYGGSDMEDVVYTGQEHMVFVGYRILEDNPCGFQDYDPFGLQDYDDNKTLKQIIDEGADLRSFYRTSPLISV